MIRHLVAFTFRDDTDDASRRRLLDEIEGLPNRFPAMGRFALAANISRRDGTFTHAFSVEFSDEAALLAYLDSAEHEDFVTNRFRPIVERRTIVSIDDEVPA